MSTKGEVTQISSATQPEKLTSSKLSLVRGSAILFHNDELGAWVAPGRVLIYSRTVATAVANKMRFLMDGK